MGFKSLLGSLFIDLEANAAGFESDMGRAARIAEKRTLEIKRSAEEAGRAVGLAFAAMTTATVIGVKNAIAQADELGKAAQKTGVQVERLASLRFAGRQNGVEFDALTQAMLRLNDATVQAVSAQGSQRAAFSALGITLRDLKTLSADQLLAKIAQGFSQAKDDASKSAVAMALFGKTGTDLIPMLNGGAQGLADMTARARALGFVVDNNTAQAAAAFNDRLGDLRAQLDGIYTRIAAKLLPELTRMTAQLSDPEFQRSLEAMVDRMTGLVELLVRAGPELLRIFAALRGASAGFAVGTALGGPLGALIGTAAGATLGEFSPEILDALTSGMKRYAAASNEAKYSAIAAATAATSAAGSRFPAIRLGSGGDSRKSLGFDPNAKPISTLDQRAAMVAGDIGDEVQRMAAERLHEIEAQLQALIKIEDEANQQLKRFQESIKTPEQRARDQLDLNQKAIDNAPGLNPDDRYQLRLANEQQFADSLLDIQLERINKEVEAERRAAMLKQQILQQQLQVAENIFGNLALAFQNSGRRGFEAFKALSVAQTTISTIEGAWGAYAQAMTVIPPPAGQAVGIAAAAAVTAAGLARVAQISSMHYGGAYAEGGRPAMGTWNIVGERGPEVFVPDRPGTILPNELLRSLGGGAVAPQVQIVNNGAPMSVQETQWDGRTMRVFVDAARAAVASDIADLRTPTSRALASVHRTSPRAVR